MTEFPLPDPARLRQIPPQFSWLDHRLVRDRHFEHCSCEALALYLFLTTVADHRGLSYYSASSLSKQLKLEHLKLNQARDELVQARLIAYQHPLYQVLSLPDSKPAAALRKPTAPPERVAQPLDVKQLLQQLNDRRRS